MTADTCPLCLSADPAAKAVVTVFGRPCWSKWHTENLLTVPCWSDWHEDGDA